MDSSPTRQFAYDMDTSPTRHTCRILAGRPLRISVTASRSSGLQSKNRPIFIFLSISSLVLKLFTVFTVTVVSSNIFHFEITLNEKSTSSHLYYIDTLSTSMNDHRCMNFLFDMQRAVYFQIQLLLLSVGCGATSKQYDTYISSVADSNRAKSIRQQVDASWCETSSDGEAVRCWAAANYCSAPK